MRHNLPSGLLALTVAVAGCPCVEPPEDGHFACASDDDCLPGGQEWCAPPGYCWRVRDAGALSDAAAPDAAARKDAAEVGPPDGGEEWPDAEALPGLDAQTARPDATAVAPDASVPDAGSATPDGGCACDPRSSDGCVGGVCQCGSGPACPGLRACVGGGCACPSATAECGAEDCCGPGQSCSAGKCFACGGLDQACCGDACGPNLVCARGMCVPCGALGLPCCAGSHCAAGYCSAGTCLACGRTGEPCCAGGACLEPTTVCDLAAKVCVPCGGPGLACCPGNGCAAGQCCGSAHRCVAEGGACDSTATCCAGSSGDSCQPHSCVHGNKTQCGGLKQGCCTTPVGTAYCTAPLTACDSKTVNCVPCGFADQPCCEQTTCFDSVCMKAVNPPTCEACGEPGQTCCPGMRCLKGCCNPESNRCVDLLSSCGQWGSCEASGRCADCGNLGMECCTPTGCLPGFACAAQSCQ